MKVVEIKNRVDRSIFDKVTPQDMDRIQVLTYMALTQTQSAFLVQQYCEEIKWTPIQDPENSEFFSMMPKVVDFLKLVDGIVFNSNPSLRLDYIKYRFLKENSRNKK
jgi:hypothetical protein